MFGFLPNNLYTGHMGANTSGLSPRLWGRVSGSMMASDGNKRLVLAGDDFVGVDAGSSSTEIRGELPYVGFIDTGGTITGLADEKGGVISLATDATGANEEVGIMLGDGTQQLCRISDTAADAHLTAFECRVKVSSITDGVMSMFCGLGSPGAVAGNCLTDTTGVPKATTTAFLGFNIKADDGDSIDFVYQASGQTRVDKIAGVAVPEADTFVKLGFVYDPTADAAKRITVYVNNVEQGTYVSGSDIATATFPDAEALTAMFAQKSITESANELAVDWWGCAQLI